MTDADFRDLFARVEQPFEPRPEFVARLLSDIDTVAAPSGAVPDSPGTAVHGLAETDGSRPERAYLLGHTEQDMVASARPRAPRRRAIAVVAAVAAVIVATLVAVTRPSAHHEPKPVAPAHLPAPSIQPLLYWADFAGLGRANLDGTKLASQLLGVGLGPQCGMTVDRNYVYWTNYGPGVARARRDGTGLDDAFIPLTSPAGPHEPQCVAVADAHVYWTSVPSAPGPIVPVLVHGPGTIGRANLDGTGVEESFISGIDLACGLALDGSHIYWSGAGKIGRANLDGTGVIPDFITFPTSAGPPRATLGAAAACGLVVDGAHIYWGGAGGTIGRANLDGTDVNMSFISEPGVPANVTVCAHDDSYLYWAVPYKGIIGRARLDGTDVRPDFVTGLAHPGGCAVTR
jgi:hypothetical protein